MSQPLSLKECKQHIQKSGDQQTPESFPHREERLSLIIDLGEGLLGSKGSKGQITIVQYFSISQYTEMGACLILSIHSRLQLITGCSWARVGAHQSMAQLSRVLNDCTDPLDDHHLQVEGSFLASNCQHWSLSPRQTTISAFKTG